MHFDPKDKANCTTERTMKQPEVGLTFQTVQAAIFAFAALAYGIAAHAQDSKPMLKTDVASKFAQLALKGISNEYPNKLDHVMARKEDVQAPRTLHPAFFGCYDWHSSVHGHW